MFNTSKEVIDFVKIKKIQFIDIRFTDLPGMEHHFTIPANDLNEFFFIKGQPFDGSSIRGFQNIADSDMQLLCDPHSAYIDPFRKSKTLIFNSSVINPRTKKSYNRDSRSVAKRAEEFLTSNKFANKAFFAPEAEFYIFDNIQYKSSENYSFYKLDSIEAPWNSDKNENGNNLGNKIPTKRGYFPVAPIDQYSDLRDHMCLMLAKTGIQIERAHHEVGAAGQTEINYKFNTLKSAADDLQKFKYVIKVTAFLHKKSVTFMPKPIFNDNGSGMHCHQSLWLNNTPLFYKSHNYADLSDLARWYIGGLLKHSGSVLAFTNPTVNSYRRLVKGFEAPINMVYSQGNRSAGIRIPITGSNPKAKRIEFRTPDSSSNPYLSFSAQLMAGLDGIRNKIEPPKPLDKDLYNLDDCDEINSICNTPNNLDDALIQLEKDNLFLQEGGVFTKDLINTWIHYKRKHEILPLNIRPNPYEFELYYSI